METLTNWYQNLTSSGQLNYDQAQEKLLAELEKFLQSFSKQNFITRWFKKDDKLGYYIYGDVGRGKSMIMNAMYSHTTTTRKTRLHFHEFMHDVHEQLGSLSNIDDPLSVIAKQLKNSYDIIYLDEMHVSDIATAMIMKRLLETLFENKIYIITSSNYHPDGLWPNGLMRERFLPAIETLKKWLNVVSLNADQDYRLINNSFNELFIINSSTSLDKLEDIFNSINLNNHINNHAVHVCGRDIPIKKSGSDVVWFDFTVVCGDMRSQLDYLELCKHYTWFIISDITQIDSRNKDVARRFTWLIDVLYDNNKKIALSSSVPIKEIYLDGDFSNEFVRTVSRLEEMQTHEYLEKNLTIKTT